MDAKLVQELKSARKIAVVRAWNLPISRKNSVHVARAIKYLPLDKAKRYLEDVLSKKRSIPFFRYNRDVAHRSDLQGPVKSGRYPEKVVKHFLRLLNSLEKNAQALGLNTDKLIIIHAAAHKGTTVPGRIRMNRVRRKRTHVEIIAMEIEQYESGKRYSKKALKRLVENVLQQWSQKLSAK
jgi:large subunit ribosomal protein L22